MRVGVEEVTMLVCGLENWVDWCPRARHFYNGPKGQSHVHG